MAGAEVDGGRGFRRDHTVSSNLIFRVEHLEISYCLVKSWRPARSTHGSEINKLTSPGDCREVLIVTGSTSMS